MLSPRGDLSQEITHRLVGEIADLGTTSMDARTEQWQAHAFCRELLDCLEA